MDAYAAALLRERAAYLQQGRPERAAEVDNELARVGVDANAVEAVIAVLAGGHLETAAAAPAPERATPDAK